MGVGREKGGDWGKSHAGRPSYARAAKKKKNI